MVNLDLHFVQNITRDCCNSFVSAFRELLGRNEKIRAPDILH